MRFQIDLTTKNNVVILDSRTMFDSVTAGALFRKLIANGWSFSEAVQAATENLPFKFINVNGRQVFLTSVPEFTPEALYTATYVRKLQTMRYMEILPDSVVKRMIQDKVITNSGSGAYAMLNHRCCATLTRQISYVVDIDKNKMSDIFGFECSPEGVKNFIEETVFFIGAESRLGYGVVDKVSVKETDRKIKRYVPFDKNSQLEYEYPFIVLRTQPPYWAKEDTTLCALAEL